MLPETVVPGGDYRIKITSVVDEAYYDFSDGSFVISSP